VTAKILAATVPPLVAFAVQAIFWSVLSPFVWLLYYPAVFISSWLGGRASGIGATLISTGTAVWYFVPPERTLAVESRYVPAIFVFAAMSIAFVVFHERLRRALRDATAALSASKQANEGLTQIANERQIYLALIESSSDFIGIADPDGNPVYVNPAGRRMVGLPADYPVEQTQIPEYYLPEARAFAADVIVKSVVETGRWSGETCFRNWQTQEPIPVSDEHFMIRDATGDRILGMGTVTRDISEARRITEQLRDSEERFRLTIDEAPIGMALVSLDGRFTRVNRVFCDIVGYSPEELAKLTFRDITSPDDVEVDIALAAQLARGEIPRYQLEKRYIRKDGTIVAIMLSASILRDRNGMPLYYIAQVEDITERNRAEAALRDSEQRLTLTLDAAQMGTWDLDPLTDTAVRSLRHARIFGYPAPAGPWGSTIFMNHIVPEDRDVANRTFTEALRSGNLDLECRIRWADQSIHWISARGRAYRNPKGELVRMLGTIQDITARKRTEEALRASERDFRSLAESMPQIVWATTADGLNIYFNQQWVDYTGLTLEESYGEGWIIPFHPDDRQRAWDAWQRATQQRDIYSLECRLRRADGVYQWWLIRGVPLLGANGEILKWFGTCTDIEHIKVAEQKLKESEAKYSGIVSISADAIVSIDNEQRITIFNNGAEQIFGYSQAEAIGTPLDRLIPERFRRTHHQYVERFASGDAIARRMGERLTTIAGLRKNGEEFPAEAAISRLQVGEKTFLTVALRDVTERKRIEKEQQFLAEAGSVLAASLDYERTLATVAHLVVRDFADWCIVETVEQHEQLGRLKVVSGDPSKSELCAALEQVPIDRERPYLLRAVVDTKQPLLVEHVTSEHLESVSQGPEHLQALRAVSPTSIMALPLLRHGQLLGVLAFLSSGSRHYGRGDLRLAEALADRAAVAIENARLYNASVEAAQIRDQVLGFVAHDLRNPLSAITMQASLLQRSGAEPERRSRKPVETIQRAAARMSRLIQDILDVSRMEGGHLSVEQERVPTEQIVSDSVEAQKPLASSASIDLQLDLEMGVSDVWADRDRVLQVFENLIGNAVKFTRPGGRITAGAASHDGKVVFWVKDTGAGISAEEMPHVFDRFWQARKSRRAGAGLGLQIVKGIVEAHGGCICVESKVGVGTTFYFTLPTAQTAGAQATQAEMH
jgi:PAS domain S-box-containing protein